MILNINVSMGETQDAMDALAFAVGSMYGRPGCSKCRRFPKNLEDHFDSNPECKQAHVHEL